MLERSLGVDRSDHPAHTPEAEMATVRAYNDVVEIVLEDAIVLRFSRGEFETNLRDVLEAA